MLTKAFILVLVMLIGLALGFETARYAHTGSVGGTSTGMVNIHLAVFAGVLLTGLWVSRAWLARQWTRFTVWLELTLDGLFDFNSLDVGDGLGSVNVGTSSALSESVRGRRLMKFYDLRFGAGSAGELRREMDALHRNPDGSLNWQASNAAIIASMERRLARVPPSGAPDYKASAQDALEDAAKTTCSGCGDRGHWSPDCPAARPPPSREGRQPDGSYVIEVGPNETHEDVGRRHPDVLFIHRESGDVLCKRGGTGAVIIRPKGAKEQ